MMIRLCFVEIRFGEIAFVNAWTGGKYLLVFSVDFFFLVVLHMGRHGLGLLRAVGVFCTLGERFSCGFILGFLCCYEETTGSHAAL